PPPAPKRSKQAHPSTSQPTNTDFGSFLNPGPGFPMAQWDHFVDLDDMNDLGSSGDLGHIYNSLFGDTDILGLDLGDHAHGDSLMAYDNHPSAPLSPDRLTASSNQYISADNIPNYSQPGVAPPVPDTGASGSLSAFAPAPQTQGAAPLPPATTALSAQDATPLDDTKSIPSAKRAKNNQTIKRCGSERLSHVVMGEDGLSEQDITKLSDYKNHAIPAEAVQVAFLTTFGGMGRSRAWWTYWESVRLAKALNRPKAPEDWGDGINTQGHSKHKQYWGEISQECFYGTRSIGALASRFTALKETYTSCLEYNKFTSDGGNGDVHYASYDRSLPKPTLLQLIGERLEDGESKGLQRNLSVEEYLTWTQDNEAGLFTLLDKFLSENPPSSRVGASHSKKVSAHGKTSSRSRARNQGDLISFDTPRNPAPIIDDDNDSSILSSASRTPYSSVVKGEGGQVSSALGDRKSVMRPMTRGSATHSSVGSPLAAGSHSRPQSSTQPTSIRSKSSAPMLSFIESMNNRTKVQEHLANIEHEKVGVLKEDQRSASVYQANRSDLDLQRQARELTESYNKYVRKLQESRTNQILQICTTAPPEPLKQQMIDEVINNTKPMSMDEYRKTISLTAEKWQKERQGLALSVAGPSIRPSDSASLAGNSPAPNDTALDSEDLHHIA
ncbi:hypothetical protein FRC10_002158, partial [Ceratobasidium sp. 414]